MKFQPEVAQALTNGKPVVALESTVISHGLPYPENQQLAEDMEATVRAGNAIPATTAVIDGVPHVGLDAEGLATLAQGTGCARSVYGILARRWPRRPAGEPLWRGR